MGAEMIWHHLSQCHLQRGRAELMAEPLTQPICAECSRYMERIIGNDVVKGAYMLAQVIGRRRPGIEVAGADRPVVSAEERRDLDGLGRDDQPNAGKQESAVKECR